MPRACHWSLQWERRQGPQLPGDLRTTGAPPFLTAWVGHGTGRLHTPRGCVGKPLVSEQARCTREGDPGLSAKRRQRPGEDLREAGSWLDRGRGRSQGLLARVPSGRQCHRAGRAQALSPGTQGGASACCWVTDTGYSLGATAPCQGPRALLAAVADRGHPGCKEVGFGVYALAVLGFGAISKNASPKGDGSPPGLLLPSSVAFPELPPGDWGSESPEKGNLNSWTISA